jgi:hypothetical protein
MMLDPTRRFYTNLTNFSGGYLNDHIESFVVGGNVRMKACQDDTFQGTCDYVTGVGGFGDVELAKSQGQFKLGGHQITAIYVGWKSEDCMNPGPFQVALFKDDDYNSLSECTIISAPWSSGALFPNASFNADANGWNGGFGLPHDSLSSIIVGSSVRVELYKESNYGGGPPLKLAPGSRIPRLAAYGFNNIVSSIKLNP